MRRRRGLPRLALHLAAADTGRARREAQHVHVLPALGGTCARRRHGVLPRGQQRPDRDHAAARRDRSRRVGRGVSARHAGQGAGCARLVGAAVADIRRAHGARHRQERASRDVLCRPDDAADTGAASTDGRDAGDLRQVLPPGAASSQSWNARTPLRLRRVVDERGPRHDRRVRHAARGEGARDRGRRELAAPHGARAAARASLLRASGGAGQVIRSARPRTKQVPPSASRSRNSTSGAPWRATTRRSCAGLGS